MHPMLLCQNMTFNQCFGKYYRTLCYFAFQYLKEVGKTEDVTQEVFMRLLEDKMTFRDEEHLRRWLYVSVRNECLNHIKSAGIHSRLLARMDHGAGVDDSNFFNGIVRAEVYRQILEAIKELPRECGRVFHLAYVEGLDNEEIARLTGVTIHTVKSHKQRAKAQLREQLKDLYPSLLLCLHLIHKYS